MSRLIKRKSFVVVSETLNELYTGKPRNSVGKEFKSQMMSDDKIYRLKPKDWDTGTMKKLIPKKNDRSRFKDIFIRFYDDSTNKKDKKSKKDEPNLSPNPLMITQSDEPLTETDELDIDDNAIETTVIDNDDDKSDDNKAYDNSTDDNEADYNKEDDNKEDYNKEDTTEVNNDENKEESKQDSTIVNDDKNNKYSGNIDENRYIKYGDSVELDDGRTGTVLYFGKTIFDRNGYWYGIQLNGNYKGKHNGRVNGIQYFKTDINKAVFVRKNRII